MVLTFGQSSISDSNNVTFTTVITVYNVLHNWRTLHKQDVRGIKKQSNKMTMSMTGAARGDSPPKNPRLAEHLAKTESKWETGIKWQLWPLDAYSGLLLLALASTVQEKLLVTTLSMMSIRSIFSDRSYLHYKRFYPYRISSIMFMKCFLSISITSKLVTCL